MKLQHTLGGLEGLGPAWVEKRVFVEAWEERIFGIHVAMMGLSAHLPTARETPSTFASEWTWADLRKGAEALNPLDYFKYRYYEKWLGGISAFFVANGHVSQEELDARAAAYLRDGHRPLPSQGDAAVDRQVIHYLLTGDSPLRAVNASPRFKVGETVRVKNPITLDHTRLPGYLRTRTGIVHEAYEGAYAYFCSTGPDGIGDPMPVYCVRFDPQDIWGALADPNTYVYADLFEAYLETA